jgi:hypothetical protein
MGAIRRGQGFTGIDSGIHLAAKRLFKIKPDKGGN